MSKVAVFLADGFEEVEGLTAIDLMRRAGIEVTTVSVKDDPFINASHKVIIKADTVIGDFDFFGLCDRF